MHTYELEYIKEFAFSVCIVLKRSIYLYIGSAYISDFSAHTYLFN